MEKLKKKIFLVIFLILTTFLISILCIFNYQTYNQERKQIENNLMKMANNRNEQFKIDQPENVMIDENSEIEKTQRPPIFMDTIAYTVIYNNNYEVIDIINHTQNNISDDEIKEIAEKILSKDDKKQLK